MQAHDHPRGGKIVSLYLKIARGGPMLPLADDASMVLEAGIGILGDHNSHRLSPRHILITSTHELKKFGIEPGALRENMTLDFDDPSDFMPGATIKIGDSVEIMLTMYCEPCKRIQHVYSKFNELINQRGILGTIKSGGEIKKNDVAFIIPNTHIPLPESTQERFRSFVCSIPRGKVVRYLEVTIGMGVADSFVRAVPGYISRTTDDSIPVHRIVDANGRLISSVPNQRELLTEDGVKIFSVGDFFADSVEYVDLESYLWQG